MWDVDGKTRGTNEQLPASDRGEKIVCDGEREDDGCEKPMARKEKSGHRR